MSRPSPSVTRHAPNGMVCSIDHLASTAGVDVMRAGGNAVDAAIATNAVLSVTSQHMCGLGGDLFALVHLDEGAPVVLNASGRAGSGADPAQMRAEGMTVMPFKDDIRSTTMPGCVDGWVTLHARFGTVPLADLLAPAVKLARDGFPASPTLVHSIPRILDVEGSDDYQRTGGVGTGDRLVREGVARTLEAISREGRDGFYGGEFGEGLVEVGGGLFTPDDLAESQADWVEPTGVRAYDHHIWTIPPNSQGYLTLAGTWITDGLDLPDDPSDPLWAHYLVESARQAGFDRPQVLNDRADGQELVSPQRLAPRREAIDPDRVSALPAPARGGGTMYMCAAMGDGTGVSLIQSNASGFGVHLTVPGPRIFLHNRGLGFSLEENHPAEFLAGRRPPHTLSPALVTRPDGTLRSVIGTMGGDTQPQIVSQMLVRMLRHGQTPGQILTAPRAGLAPDRPTGFDSWVDPSVLRIEVEDHGIDDWQAGLHARGHDVVSVPPSIGHAHLIDLDGETLAGGADPRARTGAASGF
ncbi:MAG: gamma-glutamyltranspeptidase [Actinomycetia bacterium]|nr:gamma-glutamyltranspeptidase [Actinomycetes bacterium]